MLSSDFGNRRLIAVGEPYQTHAQVRKASDRLETAATRHGATPTQARTLCDTAAALLELLSVLVRHRCQVGKAL